MHCVTYQESRHVIMCGDIRHQHGVFILIGSAEFQHLKLKEAWHFSHMLICNLPITAKLACDLNQTIFTKN